jgi:hypothetical protein
MQTRCRVFVHFRLRLALLLLLKYSLGPLTLYTFLWGIAVLVLRVTLSTPTNLLLAGLAGVPLLLAAGLVRALRRLPSAQAVRALADRQGRHGGLLLAEAETDLGAWANSLPEPELPDIVWNRAGRAGTLLLLAALFVLLTLLVPAGIADLSPAPPLEITPFIERLTRRIDVLKTVASLDPGRARALVEKLAALKTGASGKDPARTLEALDSLDALTSKTGRKAVETLLRDRDSLHRLDSLAEALLRGKGEVPPGRVNEALKELSGALKQLDHDGELAKQLGPEVMRQLNKHALTQEQLHRLDGMLKKAANERLGRLEKLEKAGLADPAAVRQARNAPRSDVEGLLARLKEVNNKRPVVELLRKTPSTNAPGASAPGYIRPPLRDSGLKANTLSEREMAERRNRKPATEPGSGALKGATVGGGSANTQVLLPRHRAAVGRYFERMGK